MVLVNIILGLIKPSSGKIFIDNEEVTDNYMNLQNLSNMIKMEKLLH